MFDALYPPGLQWYWRGDFFDGLNDGNNLLCTLNMAQNCQQDSQPCISIRLMVRQVVWDNKETAFSYRDAVWSAVYAGVDPAGQC